MKSNALHLYRAVFLTSLLVTAPAFSGEKDPTAPAAAKAQDPAAPAAAKGQDAPNMEEMMKKWQAYAAPGAGHKVLESLVGEWDVQSRSWMAGPDGPVTESKGTATVKWTLGGRYLQESFSGEMMQRPFQGEGVTAYDNFKKKYVSTWMDTMSTGIFISEGTADEAGKVLTFLGKMDEPMTGQKDKPTKYIIRITSPDAHTFEMHDLTLGEKTKVFEMTYTRKP